MHTVMATRRISQSSALLSKSRVSAWRVAAMALSWARESLRAFPAANAFASSASSLATYIWESILQSSLCEKRRAKQSELENDKHTKTWRISNAPMQQRKHSYRARSKNFQL